MGAVADKQKLNEANVMCFDDATDEFHVGHISCAHGPHL
jgi:hypothetical protein